MTRVRAIVLDNDNILLGLNKSDQYMLPGGKIHKDEHPVDAVIREVFEETGIEKFTVLNYLWEHIDNKVFLFVPSADVVPTVQHDPDEEFKKLDWFPLGEFPSEMNSYAKKILSKFVSGVIVTEAATEVWVDGEKVYEIPDDEIWETSPGLVQKTVNEGKDVSFRQTLPDGTVIDKTPHAMPETFDVEGAGQRAFLMKKIYNLIDELLTKYIPEEKARPSAEIVSKVKYLGKTTWRKMDGKDKTHILVNHKIVNNDNLLRQVLAHEIIHHHLYQKYANGVEDHGEMFQIMADRINEHEGDDFVTQYANETNFVKNGEDEV